MIHTDYQESQEGKPMTFRFPAQFWVQGDVGDYEGAIRNAVRIQESITNSLEASGAKLTISLLEPEQMNR